MARKTGTIKSFHSLWIEHEKLYYSIFYKALQQLEINVEQRKHEDAISEAFCPILKELCFSHEHDIRTPDWEKPIQPVNEEELKGGKIKKKPDFTCNFLNSLADSSTTYEIPFHVECKRLGETVGSWDLNKNYISNGINRFDSKTHEYGKRALSGIMIGYILSMEPTKILNEVNSHMNNNFPELIFDFSRKVTYNDQSLNRENIKPYKFKLIHLWSDLRSSNGA